MDFVKFGTWVESSSADRGNIKLVEVTQPLLVNEKSQGKEMEELLEIYEKFVVFFLLRTHTKL